MNQGPNVGRKPCPKDTANFFTLPTFIDDIIFTIFFTWLYAAFCEQFCTFLQQFEIFIPYYPYANIFVETVHIFSYTLKIFIKGYRKELEECDIYAVMKKLNAKDLGDKLEGQWRSNKAKKKKMTFARCLLFCFGAKFFLYGAFDLVSSTVFNLSLPNATGRLVAYFSGEQDITKGDACLYAAFIVFMTTMDLFLYNNYDLLLLELATSVRTAFCSMLYRKCLRLSPAALSEFSTGKIITLMTKDVQVLHNFVLKGCPACLAIVHIISVSTIMYIRIGFAALAGIGSFLLVIPLQVYLSKKAASMRLESSKKSDVRLQKTQEALSAIKIIKMYTWEAFFTSKITAARKAEILKLRMMNYLKALTVCLSLLGSYLSFYIMLITFIKYGDNVTAENIFYTIGLYQGLRYFITQALPLGILNLAEIYPSMKRIEALMDAEEIHSLKIEPNIEKEHKIELKNVSSEIRGNTVLSNVSCTLRKGLTIITGSLGSGKSSFLKVILKDYPVSKGQLEVRGTVSYACQDPWLFPASIRDNILFGEEFDRNRYQKTLEVCALSYDLELMINGDATIVEDHGMNLSKGQQARINLARAIYRDSDIYLLDDCLAALDVTVQEHIFKECILEFLKDKICLLVIHDVKLFKEATQILMMENGFLKSVSKAGEDLKNKVVNSITSGKAMNHIAMDQQANVDDQALRKLKMENPDESAKLLECDPELKSNIYHETKKVGGVDLTTYWRFVSYSGGIFALIVIMVLYLADQFTVSYLEIIISKWVDSLNNATRYIQNNETDSPGYLETVQEGKSYLDLYFIMLVTAHFVILLRSTVFIFLISKMSMNIHKSTIIKVMNATMEFFDGTFVGNILNRLSRDMAIIDEELPLVLSECLRGVCQIVGVFGLIVTVDAVYIMPSIIISVLLVSVRYFYMPTGRSLKRLDSATRSPVIGHLNATLEGLTTIRAYGKQDILKDEFDRHQDLYSSAYHLSCMTAKALSVALHIFSLFYTCFILIYMLFFSDTYGGDAGLVLTQASKLTNLLQFGMLQFAFLENQMTSVERILEYTNTKQEKSAGIKPENWPSEGSVIYKNVSLTYERTGETVLKNVNLEIPSKSKIGIVGRTGAGKSSIVGTLFQLYDTDGSIIIDKMEINKLSLNFLRRNLSLIPQDPVIFRNSVRENIDPFGLHSDEEIWNTLEIVKIKDKIEDLSSEIHDGSTQLSAGQRQLICIARALLQNNKIIVLDEATANMDPETHNSIQNIIKEQFKDCTVLTIAHKLDSVMESDKIMVLDSGRVVEFDSPAVLMQDKNSKFRSMVDSGS